MGKRMGSAARVLRLCAVLLLLSAIVGTEVFTQPLRASVMQPLANPGRDPYA
jgi:hypothetical protein